MAMDILMYRETFVDEHTSVLLSLGFVFGPKSRLQQTLCFHTSLLLLSDSVLFLSTPLFLHHPVLILTAFELLNLTFFTTPGFLYLTRFFTSALLYG